MRQLLIRWVINILAVFVATQLIPGVYATNGLSLAVVALVLGLVNALLRPLLILLTCPLVLLTLGLFVLVINALLFRLAAWLTPGFYVEGFWAAFWGALLVSLVSLVLNLLVGEEEEGS